MDLEIVTNEEAQDILRTKRYDKESVIGADTSSRTLIKVPAVPSGFKGYPAGTVISYEPLKMKELEALNSGKEVDIARGIALLLNAIHVNTMNSYDLAYWDVMYIGIKRKLNAFGETRGVTAAVCPVCGEIVEYEFDYEKDLAFKELEVPALPVRTTLGGKPVEIGLLTMKEFLEITPEDTTLSVVARMIKNLPYEEALDLIENLTGKDIKIIKHIGNLLNYGLKPFRVPCTGTIEKENPDYDPKDKKSKKKIKVPCNNIVELEVHSPFEVVFPKDSSLGISEDEIQFG